MSKTPLERFVFFWLPLLLVLSLGTPTAAQKEVPATEPAAEATATVTIDGINLFSVKERVLSFSPEERAKAITGRIEKVAASFTFDEKRLGVVAHESSSDVVADDIIVMTVSDADAKAEGVTREKLAGQRLEQIRDAITSYRQLRSSKQLMAGALYGAAATVALLLLLTLINWGFKRLKERIETLRGRLIRSIRIQKLELLQEDRIVAGLHIILRILRLVAILLLLEFYLVYVLSMFPWTRGIAGKMTGYVMAPLQHIANGFLASLPNIVFVVVTVFVAYLVTKCVRFFFNELGKGTITIGGFQPDWAESSYKIARFLIIAFCVVVIFPYLPGSESPAFKGVSVFLGILLSLGSTSAVSNIVAGVILTYTGAFKLGDRVKIAETVGDVLEKNLLVTRVRTIKNVDITIPNSMVLSSHLINYSSSAQVHGLILNTTVTIGYDAPWRKVHETLIAAARATEHIKETPAPFVLQTALNDFYVSYELNAYTEKSQGMARIYSELHQNIQDKFNEAGIEIMSPHYATLRDGNQSTIPADYLPKDYEPPSFRV